MSSQSKLRRIVFIGAECTGKSTLAQAVAARLGAPCSEEYVRIHAEQLERPLDATDLEPIAHGQLRLEDQAATMASEFVVHDTNILSSILYAEHYFDTHLDWVDSLFEERCYDSYFLCQSDIPWVADPGQRVSPEERALLQERFIAILNRYDISYVPVCGTLEERITIVNKKLGLD
ncbi:AAA family ATPase [Pelagicoccus albus]|uniref:ATP-binding protein n=1 Tax=Pelagicoccus albus TaxID=415222 RepID=A0A7X1B8C1_9BACT|nr:ATP-binding protein [Pelagicoccus albus]MBC2607541.1 ATP-binding protein [Pelagicoccus albus]